MWQLHSRITQKDKPEARQPSEKIINKEATSKRDVGTWLQATLPSLYVPRQNYPWVQTLRVLAHGGSEV